MAYSDSSYSNPYDPADIPLRQHAGLVGGPQGEGFNEWTPYGGPRNANWNPYQQQAYNKAGPGYGQFQGFGQGLTGRGTSLMSSGNRAIGRGQGLTGNYGTAQGYYGDAIQKGSQFGDAGLGAAFGGYGNMAQQDPLAFAARAANNPYMDGMVDAASRDVSRNLHEQTLPGIAGKTASTNTLGSSRRGMLEGIAKRGAEDRVADIGAQLRGGAYGQGVGQGLQQQQFGTQGLGNLGQIGLQQGNLGASGMMGLGQAGQGMMGLGSNMMQAGAGLGHTGFGIFNGANQGQYNMGLNRQQDHQMRMDRNQQHYYRGQQMPYDQAAAGMNVLMPWSNAYGQSFQPGAGAISGNQWTGMGIDLASQAAMAAATGGMSGITGSLGSMMGGGQPSMNNSVNGNQYGTGGQAWSNNFNGNVPGRQSPWQIQGAPQGGPF